MIGDPVSVAFELRMTAGEAVNVCYRLQDTTGSGELLGTDVPAGEWHELVCRAQFGMGQHTDADREHYR